MKKETREELPTNNKKKQFPKIKYVLSALTVLVLLVIGGVLFYWFQYRPAQIRHDCSWVKVHSDGTPARPAMKEAELKAQNLIKDCSNTYTSIFGNNTTNSCENNNQAVVEAYSKPQPAVSPSDSWRKATTSEYNFCLHDKGL